MLFISIGQLLTLHLLIISSLSSLALGLNRRQAAPQCLGITDPGRCNYMPGCVYYNSGCHRNVNCVQAVDLTCSDECHSCSKYGCIPGDEVCPLDCSTVTQQAACTTGGTVNAIQCVWNAQANTCGFSSPVIYDPRFAPAVAGLAAAFQQDQQQKQLAALKPTSNDGSGVSSSRPNNDGDGDGDDDSAKGFNTLMQGGVNSKWAVYAGGAVGAVALAGIAMLAVHKAKKMRDTRREMRRHPVVAGNRRIFQRQSFIPGVQRALDNVSSVQPAYVRQGGRS